MSLADVLLCNEVSHKGCNSVILIQGDQFVIRELRILEAVFNSLLENPLETDPGIPLVIDPPLLFFSSDTQMQAVGIKNRSSLHSA